MDTNQMNPTPSFAEVLRSIVAANWESLDPETVEKISSAHQAAIGAALARRDKECKAAGHIILRGAAAKRFANYLEQADQRRESKNDRPSRD